MKNRTIKDERLTKKVNLMSRKHADVIKAISHTFTKFNTYKISTFYDRKENSSLENQCYNVCKLKTPNKYNRITNLVKLIYQSYINIQTKFQQS